MTAYSGALLSMGHREHPLLGQRVVDGAHGDVVGVLRGVAPDIGNGTSTNFNAAAMPSRSELERAEPVAWIAPEGGGVEWPTPVDAIRPA